MNGKDQLDTSCKPKIKELENIPLETYVLVPDPFRRFISIIDTVEVINIRE